MDLLVLREITHVLYLIAQADYLCYPFEGRVIETEEGADCNGKLV